MTTHTPSAATARETRSPTSTIDATEKIGRLRLDEQLCFALYAATNAVTRAYRPLLRRIGLTYPQYVVMMALWESDDVTVTDLAVRLDLPVHGLSPVLDRLTHAHLIDRHTDPADRRIRRLTLTEQGRDLEQQAARAQAQVVRDSQLPPTRLNLLCDELHALSDNLRSASPVT